MNKYLLPWADTADRQKRQTKWQSINRSVTVSGHFLLLPKKNWHHFHHICNANVKKCPFFVIIKYVITYTDTMASFQFTHVMNESENNYSMKKWQKYHENRENTLRVTANIWRYGFIVKKKLPICRMNDKNHQKKKRKKREFWFGKSFKHVPY